MSLIVSLRVPDGIVIATDSMSTSNTIIEMIAMEGSDQHSTKKKVNLPKIEIPFSASSHVQKLFPLCDYYAISTHGAGVLNQKSIYYHIKCFEEEYQKKVGTIANLKDSVVKYFEHQVALQFKGYKSNAPDNFNPVSFHINGFEKKGNIYKGITYQVNIKKETEINRITDIGCTIGGSIQVAQKLWSIGKEAQGFSFKYQLFSLQDAIDFCEFLIDTTAKFHRFAIQGPMVGGEIDIALVSPFNGFQWIKRKNIINTLDQKPKFDSSTINK